MMAMNRLPTEMLPTKEFPTIALHAQKTFHIQCTNSAVLLSHPVSICLADLSMVWETRESNSQQHAEDTDAPSDLCDFDPEATDFVCQHFHGGRGSNVTCE